MSRISVPANVCALIRQIKVENPLHSNFIDASMLNLSSAELQQLSRFLDYCFSIGHDIPYMAESYLTLVEDTIREQMFFRKHHRYRFSKFEDVAAQVYFDHGYMDRYMHGLAISAFLWSNHVQIVRYFKQSLPKFSGGRYLEIGPGHGQFFIAAMHDCQFADYLGVDISETSIRQTRSIIDYFMPHHGRKARLETRDFLAQDDLQPGSFDAIVAGEVVEHVEQPDVFFRRIAELAKPDAFIFLTTCINTPAIDHIYLWRTLDDLEAMIMDCGLRVRDKLTLPYQGKSIEEANAEELPVNFAFLLDKA